METLWDLRTQGLTYCIYSHTIAGAYEGTISVRRTSRCLPNTTPNPGNNVNAHVLHDPYQPVLVCAGNGVLVLRAFEQIETANGTLCGGVGMALRSDRAGSSGERDGWIAGDETQGIEQHVTP